MLRTKIVKQADLATHTQQLNKMNQVVKSAHGAYVRAQHMVYSGVVIGINDSVHTMMEEQDCISFEERDSRVVMFSMKGEMVG